MSYQLGIFMPILIVTGLFGALGRIHLTPGSIFWAAISSGKKLHPAPLSPNPCANMTDAVCLAREGMLIADM